MQQHRRHSQFSRHDPSSQTFRSRHKTFSRTRVGEKFLFPVRSRIIKGRRFLQLGSLADISAVGNFPGQLFWEVEEATMRWSPLASNSPQGPPPTSDAVSGAQILFSHGPYKGSTGGDSGWWVRGACAVTGKARRLILGGSLGDTLPCSTFATTSSSSFLKHSLP